MTTLFDPIQVGDLQLANRIVMAPLTRNRALPGNIPGPLTVEYYRQRATAGLIVAEASPISPTAQGYLDTPGIWSDAQVQAWQQVTQAVHAEGGKIVLQLWHVGRISHTSLLPDGEQPVSSTNQTAKASTFTRDGFVPVSAPRALRDDEIPGLINDYRRAARNAIAAGFDGVEIHAANTYLIEQFLRDSVNDRTGPYGGSIENRTRLLLEVVDAVVGEIGAGRTGIRLSPMTTFTAPLDSNPQALYGHVVEKLAPIGLAYLHVIEGETGGTRTPEGKAFDYEALHKAFKGTWMVNNGYKKELATSVLASGQADLIAFGRLFISNPDLVRRLREGAEFNALQADKLYGGGAAGYTDYPTLA
ncbi:MAG: alkene reductase [Limnobacter sp.]|uniref:alkene reductase n=1 Tax=Limnobacter sp. TaxID=2003368 RepID=UPI00391D028F